MVDLDKISWLYTPSFNPLLSARFCVYTFAWPVIPPSPHLPAPFFWTEGCLDNACRSECFIFMGTATCTKGQISLPSRCNHSRSSRPQLCMIVFACDAPAKPKASIECSKILLLIFERSQVEISTRKPAYPETWRDFTQSIIANPGIVFWIRPRPLPPNCFPTHYFLIMPPFHSMSSELLIVSLNNNSISA